ncbi:MAG: hypothetical protein D6715_01090 [Calditrichaeota bacterium]|nr:MAG: hypothetical protein D6715_01090 [Calditrichota bacterium]
MKKSIVPVVFLGYFGLIAAVLLFMGFYWQAKYSPPEQPIKFPHYIHAGKLGLDCKFCHQYVDKSIHATVPAMQICMNCHQTAAHDRPEVQKLLKYWENKEPIPWVKVHDVPDYVYFSHKRHIKAGIDCANCHGDMKVVRQVRQTRTLRMGFCVSCHRLKGAPTDCWTCHK